MTLDLTIYSPEQHCTVTEIKRADTKLDTKKCFAKVNRSMIGGGQGDEQENAKISQ